MTADLASGVGQEEVPSVPLDSRDAPVSLAATHASYDAARLGRLASPRAGGTGDGQSPIGTPKRRVLFLAIGLSVALLVAIVVAAGSGHLNIPASDVISTILHAIGIDVGTPASAINKAALIDIRLPRVVMAIAVGGALAVAGAVMQGVFGNPLAEPGVVGVSSGAALAACASIVFGWAFWGEWTIAVLAFIGGVVTCLLVYLLSRSAGRTETVTMVLTGVAVNAVAGAGLALLTFLGDTQAREQIVFWQLGSLNGTRWQYVRVVLPIVVVGVAAAIMIARKLDLIALGERSASHLGVNVERLRLTAVVIVALLTAAAVAFCGIIGFVGLVVPHVMRMIVGPGHRALLPLSALGGALLLLLADTVARTAIPYADLPIGMLTALVGGPVFFYLIRRTRRTAGGWA